MKKLMVNALNVGIALALTFSLGACNRSADAGTANGTSESSQGVAGDVAGGAAAADTGPKYGKVVSVDPVRSSTNNPRQVCHDVVVNHTAPPKDQHRVAGTAIGAVVGGLLGNQVGGGKGKTLATVAGAVGGGYAGNRIEASRQHGQVTSSVERKCSTVNDSSSKIVGYDVRYTYNGVTRTTRMDHDPGDRVQIEEGVIAVSDARGSNH
ncbi:MAG: glycine zipper 2TM domain-containing protein [Rhodanobacter sp.]